MRLYIDPNGIVVKNDCLNTVFEAYDTNISVGEFYCGMSPLETTRCDSETKQTENEHSFSSCLVETWENQIRAKFIKQRRMK